MPVRELRPDESITSVRPLGADEDVIPNGGRKAPFLQRARDIFTGELRREEELSGLFEQTDLEKVTDAGTVLRLAGAFVLTGNEQSVADIVEESIPGATRETDAHGNVIVSLPFPEGRRRLYVNVPGIDFTDATLALSQILQFTPAGRFARTATTTFQAVRRAGTVSAGVSIGQDIGAEALGGQQGVDPTKAAFAAGGGATAEILAPLFKFARQIILTRRFFNRRTGQLTEAGRRRAEDAGIDPATFDDELGQLFGQNLARGDDATTAMGRALSERFGVPLARGQVTQTAKDLRSLERIRETPFGAGGSVVRALEEDVQPLAIREAGRDIQRRLVGPDITETAVEATEDFVGTVRQLRRQLKTEVDVAFDTLRSSTARFRGESLATLNRATRAAIHRDFPGLRIPGQFTQSKKGLLLLGRLTRRVRNAAKRGQTISGQEFIATRQALLDQIDKASGPDQAALIRIKAVYDDFLTESAVNAAFGGDDTFIAIYRDAARKNTKFRRLFTKQRDDLGVGAVVERIVNESMPAEQAFREIFGQRLGAVRTAVPFVQRLKEILGQRSAPFQRVREAAFNHLTKIGDKTVDAGAIRARLVRLFSEQPTLARELFGEQANMLRQYSELMARIVEIPSAVKRAHAVNLGERLMRTGLQMQAQREKFVLGNIITGNILRLLAKIRPSDRGTFARGQVRLPRQAAGLPTAIGAAAGSQNAQELSALLPAAPATIRRNIENMITIFTAADSEGRDLESD